MSHRFNNRCQNTPSPPPKNTVRSHHTIYQLALRSRMCTVLGGDDDSGLSLGSCCNHTKETTRIVHFPFCRSWQRLREARRGPGWRNRLIGHIQLHTVSTSNDNCHGKPIIHHPTRPHIHTNMTPHTTYNTTKCTPTLARQCSSTEITHVGKAGDGESG